MKANRKPRPRSAGKSGVLTSEVVGGRFSRGTYRTYSADAQGFAAFDKSQSQQLPARRWLYEALVPACAELLRDRGLPNAPNIVGMRTERGEWEYAENGKECLRERAQPGATIVSSELRHHILWDRGYKLDSPEELSARVISLADSLQRAESGEPFEVSFRLGEAWALLRVYLSLKTQQRKPKGKRKGWLQTFVHRLLRENPGANAAELWRKLGELSGDLELDDRQVAGWIRLDGNTLVYGDSGGRVEEAAFETFRRYVRAARELCTAQVVS